MARTDNRLDLDANLVGYWGFDETLETDNAIDESQYADAHLTVTNATSVQTGRVGGSRQLSASAYASITLARLRITGDGVFTGWFKLSSVNNSGSLLRAFVSCAGPTTGDNQLFGLYVDNGGRLVYKHSSASGEVVVRTGINVIRINQYYNVAVLRSSGGTQVQLFVDNFNIPIADVTVNGGASSLPVPAPSANASAIFSVGRSQKETDSAFWDGLVDEVSVHNTARLYQPYLRGAYFRAALRSGTSRITSTNTILSVASSDMGSGVRWWCYERDKDLYVAKESPFGFFGPETRLTTPGGFNATTTTKPELIYDAATDVLLVVFVAGNRIFKLTATSTDDPATINMPFTADAGSILKLLENIELWRGGDGYGGQREPLSTDITIVSKPPIKIGIDDVTWVGADGVGANTPDPSLGMAPPVHVPLVAFVTDAVLGFGVSISAKDFTQATYAAYKIVGGLAIPMAAPVYMASNYGMYFAAISPRVDKQRYVIEVLDKSGNHTRFFSEVLEDRLQFEPYVGDAANSIFLPGYLTWESGSLGDGYGGQRELLTWELVSVNKVPLKFALQEPTIADIGDGYGGQLGSCTQNGVTVMTL